MARKPKFKVRSRGKSWIVEVGATVSVTGRRERLFFSTKREAEARAVQLREEHFKFGVAAHKLPHALQIDAVKSAEILAPYGASLADAARLFADVRAKQEKSVEFTALIAPYLENKSLSDSSAQKESGRRRASMRCGTRPGPGATGRLLFSPRRPWTPFGRGWRGGSARSPIGSPATRHQTTQRKHQKTQLKRPP